MKTSTIFACCLVAAYSSFFVNALNILDVFVENDNFFHSLLQLQLDNLIKIANVGAKEENELRQCRKTYSSLQTEVIFWCSQLPNNYQEKTDEQPFREQIREKLKLLDRSLASTNLNKNKVEFLFAPKHLKIEMDYSVNDKNNVQEMLFDFLAKILNRNDVTEVVTHATLFNRLQIAKFILKDYIKITSNKFSNINETRNMCDSILLHFPTPDTKEVMMPMNMPAVIITQSYGDSLTFSQSGCSAEKSFGYSDSCEVILTKNTFSQFVSIYGLEEPVDKYFDNMQNFNVPQICKDTVKKFFKEKSIDWRYTTLAETNKLKVQICLQNGQTVGKAHVSTL